MKHCDFVHLHVHSQYSLLDGACKIDRLIEHAHSLHMPALAISDHGNMFGAIEFFREAMNRGIKPIIGCELYMASGSRHQRGENGGRQPIYHLTLLVKDETGYRNLVRLVSLGYLEGFYYKPRIDKDALTHHHEGLIGLSGCLKGEIASLIQHDQITEAYQVASWYNDVLGNENFYLEMMDHGIAAQQSVNRILVKMSRDLGIPLVATNDVHYLRKDMAHAHEVLLCLQTQTTLSDTKHMRMSTEEFYFKSAQEMKQTFAEVPQAISNTLRITEMCNLELDFERTHFPRYDLPAGETPMSALRKLCEERLEHCYPGIPDEVRARLHHELDVIERQGFAGYFLIVSDFVRFAKNHDIPVGPGRGSAAGSIVSYLCGITQIDPLRYDLLFERFLNPERVSFPDIDIDFCYERRDEVIRYVSEKYGNENVAQIITFGTMMAKAVVRDVGRVLNIPYAEVDKIAKLIPSDPKMTLSKALELEPELKHLYRATPHIRKLMDVSLVLEGLTRHASTHAAGVVISDRPLYENIPVYRSAEGQITTGFSMKSLEKIGLLKMDFLGLKTLTVIAEALKIIKRTCGRQIDVSSLPMDDHATYELFKKAQTLGIFQLESSGMRELLKKLQPDSFEDIIALLALYRPGPLGSGMVDDFIKRKRTRSKVQFDHPLLESILKDTYGIILYQEQVMRITNVLAGFSLAQADLMRRAMGKKIPEELEKLKDHFIRGALHNGVSRKVADKVFGLIEYFAGYGFNKSHSAAYALISYQTAYLKANYPVEFMAALLTSEKDNSDKISTYIAEARLMGIKILPPDVNDSFSQFTVVGTDAIRFGLSAVKNVGTAAVEAIIAARRQQGAFTSLYDFCRRVESRSANRKVMESLIKCGALGSIQANRRQLFTRLDNVLSAASAEQRDQQSGQLLLFSCATEPQSLPSPSADVEEWSLPEMLAQEKEMLNFYVSAHPLAQFQSVMRRYSVDTVREVLAHPVPGAEVTVAGMLEKIRFLLTKKKAEKMAVARLEDVDQGIEIVIFPEAYKNAAAVLKEDTLMVAQGKLDLKEENPKIIVSRIFPLASAARELVSSLTIRVSPQKVAQHILPAVKTLILAHPGETPVHIAVAESERGKHIHIKANAHVSLSDDLLSELEHLLGKEDVCIVRRK